MHDNETKLRWFSSEKSDLISLTFCAFSKNRMHFTSACKISKEKFFLIFNNNNTFFNTTTLGIQINMCPRAYSFNINYNNNNNNNL